MICLKSDGNPLSEGFVVKLNEADWDDNGREWVAMSTEFTGRGVILDRAKVFPTRKSAVAFTKHLHEHLLLNRFQIHEVWTDERWS